MRLETLRRIETLGLAAGGVRAAAEGDPDPRVRGAAWRTLAAMGGPDVAPALLARLQQGAPTVRLGALAAAGTECPDL